MLHNAYIYAIPCFKCFYIFLFRINTAVKSKRNIENRNKLEIRLAFWVFFFLKNCLNTPLETEFYSDFFLDSGGGGRDVGCIYPYFICPICPLSPNNIILLLRFSYLWRWLVCNNDFIVFLLFQTGVEREPAVLAWIPTNQ